MIVSIELGVYKDGKSTLVYLDHHRGQDVICNVNEDGTLELAEYVAPKEFATSRKITIHEFIKLVSEVALQE